MSEAARVGDESVTYRVPKIVRNRNVDEDVIFPTECTLAMDIGSLPIWFTNPLAC